MSNFNHSALKVLSIAAMAMAALSMAQSAKAQSALVYQKNGTTVILDKAQCTSPVSKVLQDRLYLKADHIKQLTFQGPKSSTKGCWASISQGEEVAVVTEVDKQVAVLPISEFKPQGASQPAPAQRLNTGTRGLPSGLVNGQSINPETQSGTFIEQARDNDGRPFNADGFNVYDSTTLNPQERCGARYPRLAQVLQMRNGANFSMAYSGVFERFTKTSQGVQILQTLPVCYIVKAGSVLIFGVRGAYSVPASHFSSGINLEVL